MPRQNKTWQPLDQTCHRSHPCAMLAAVIAVGSGNTLKAANLPNRLFDHDAKLGKGAIVDHVLWRTLLATRFWSRRKAMLSQFRQLQIGQITTPRLHRASLPTSRWFATA
jgi:hypothetical protein